MTVAELITELTRYPKDAWVQIRVPLDHLDIRAVFQPSHQETVVIDTVLKPPVPISAGYPGTSPW